MARIRQQKFVMQASFRERIFRTWARLTGRPSGRRLNHLLLNLATRGLGVGNSAELSGEAQALYKLAPRWRNMRSDAVLLDVGANEGDYSALLRKLCPEARIFALEPHPATAIRLFDRLGETVSVHTRALGERAGFETLWDYNQVEGSQHASMVQGVIDRLHNGTAIGKQVEVTTLDAFCSELGLTHIDLLKLDVEGLEADCLRGARSLIAAKAIRFVQFEFNSMHVMSRTTFLDFVEMLPNFRFYRLLPHGLLELQSTNILRCHLYDFQNILAVSPQVVYNEVGLGEKEL